MLSRLARRRVPWVVGRSAAALVLSLGPAVGFAQTGSAQGPATPPPSFSGSSSALGVRVTLTIPGAPGTGTPVDGGGPTAQVAVDSTGGSTGYAAFPDPGEFILSLPGLGAGLLASGAGGLPPIKVPSPPNYPFFVSSDANGPTEASQGSGPYQLSARSDAASSAASATGGFSTGLTGNASLLTSTASLNAMADQVVSTATNDAQAITFGPVTFGEIRSKATLTMGADGTVTPSTSLEISGVKIGGWPVSITPAGLASPGPTVPLPINDTLAAILKSSGVTVQVVKAKEFPGRVVAPGVVVTMPFDFAIPNVGKYSGTMVVTFGEATAALSGAAAPDATPDVPTGGSIPTGGTDLGGQPISARPGLLGSPAPAFALPSPIVPPAPFASGSPFSSGSLIASGSPIASAALGTTTPTVTGENAAALPATLGLWDIRSLYLTVLAGAVAALILGQLIRLLGVRSWTLLRG